MNSGTDAILIALQALGIGPGDEVISPAHNVAYTALAVNRLGAKNVFVDIDPLTMLMDCDRIQDVITGSTRAIVPVHLYGQMVNMKRVRDIARANNLMVVEDAAQAHGALYDGHPPGYFSHAVAYSFYPTKNLGSLGEAGGITTNIPSVAKAARQLRDGGRSDRYIHSLPGVNSVMDEIQAAVLRVKLKHLDLSNRKRCKLAFEYIKELSRIEDIRLQVWPQKVSPVYHLFVIRIKRRTALMQWLKENEVPTLIHYPLTVPEQPVFVSECYEQGPFPHAQEASRTVLSLPMFPDMSKKQQDWIIGKIKAFFDLPNNRKKLTCSTS